MESGTVCDEGPDFSSAEMSARTIMKSISFLLLAVAALAGALTYMAPASGQTDKVNHSIRSRQHIRWNR